MQPIKNNNPLATEFYRQTRQCEDVIHSLTNKDKQKQVLETLAEHILEVKNEQMSLFNKAYEKKILPQILKLIDECNLKHELNEYFSDSIYDEIKYQVNDAIHDYHYAHAKNLGLVE